MQTTEKKVKVIGTQLYIKATTGELEEMQVTSIENRDFNFTKVWMKNFIATLELVGNQKSKVAFWIIDHINKENQLPMNYRQIAAESGVSYQTVALTMKILMNADFLRKINTCYVVNPDIASKGTRNGRLNCLNQYQDAPKTELSIQDKMQNIQKSIEELQQQYAALEKEAAKLTNEAPEERKLA